MGVNGLWKLLEPVGRPVSLEALERKILAVDISVWLNQALYGMRNQYGNTISNAHLALLFQRICKLLFYKVKPIFVFDGGVPELKKKTMAARREIRLSAHHKASAISHKVLRKFIKSHVIGGVTGNVSKKSTDVTTEVERDLFQLSPLPEEKEMNSVSEDESFPYAHHDLQNLEMEGVDIDSEDFRKLPPEIQHELIVEMHEKSKRHSRYQAIDMPEETNDFSNFQLTHLLKRGKLTQRLGVIRKELNEQGAGELALNIAESKTKGRSSIQSQKIMSEDSGHYILIKQSGERKKDNADKDNKMAGGFFRDGFPNERDLKSLVSATLPRVSEAITPSSVNCALDEDDSTSEDDRSSSHDAQDVTDLSFPSSTGLKKPSSPTNIKEDTCVIIVHDSAKKLDDEQGMTIEKPYSAQADEDAEKYNASDVTVESIENVIESNSIAVKNTATETARKHCGIYETNTPEEKSPIEETSEVPDTNQILANASETNILAEDHDIDDFEDEIKQKKMLIEKLLDIRKTTWQRENLQPGNNKEQLLDGHDISEDFSTVNQRKMDEHHLSENLSEEKYDVCYPFAVIDSGDDKTIPVYLESPGQTQLAQTQLAVNEFQGMSHEDLEEMQERLNEDLDNLKEERSRQNRLAATVSDEMYKDSQELLQLFGIPFVVSPMEAEAQCATLDTKGLCEGSITEDSDIMLFGGRKVYKNIFNQKKDAEVYQDDDLKNVLGLDRQNLITIALLTGSDYTEGVQGIGVVSAMEVIQEFSGEGIDKLKNLKNWLTESNECGYPSNQSKVKNKLRNITLPVGFPSQQVFDAYLNPTIDDSSEAFSWGNPDLHGLRLFASEKLGWSKSKTDEILLPVLKRLNSTETQSKIDAFFPVQFNDSKRIKSRRVKRVVDRLLHKDLDENDDNYKKEKSKARAKKRKTPRGQISRNRSHDIDEESNPNVTNVGSSSQQNNDSTDSTSDTSEEEAYVPNTKNVVQSRDRRGHTRERGLQRAASKRKTYKQ